MSGEGEHRPQAEHGLQHSLRPPAEIELNAPWEKAFDRVTTPFEEYLHAESTGGIVLLAATVLALLIANSPLAEPLHHLLEMPLTIGIGSWALSLSLHHWINDGLMGLFFFVVGLEIKREVLVGELADPRQAALPAVAAVGGMLVPALIYYAFNPHGPAQAGWGIPMATDIAFAVGAIALLGSRVPKGLVTFLVALAIVDDLGAVLVIALFYTEQIDWGALGAVAVLLGLLFALGRFGIRRPWVYIAVGAIVWLAMLKSGIHATVAGVLVALTVPTLPKYEPQRFSDHVRRLMERYDLGYTPGESILRNRTMLSVLQTLENGVHQVQTPLHRLEHSLHLPIAMLVMPVFALANAGIPLNLSTITGALAEPVTLGVGVGLLLGKLTGVVGFSWLAVRSGLGKLPPGVNFRHMIGAGLLAGIGFTMSLFIAGLGFAHAPELLQQAKTGILLASLVAGIAGYLWLKRVA